MSFSTSSTAAPSPHPSGYGDGASPTADSAGEPILGLRNEDYPVLYRAADAASRRAHLAHSRLMGAELLLLVGAAGIGAAQ